MNLQHFRNGPKCDKISWGTKSFCDIGITRGIVLHKTPRPDDALAKKEIGLSLKFTQISHSIFDHMKMLILLFFFFTKKETKNSITLS